MPIQENLVEMERFREAYWRRRPNSAPAKLRWRALTVRHCFHLLPGETILELGAGSGLWTEKLVEASAGRNPITAVVFNEDLAAELEARDLPNVKVVLAEDPERDLATEEFDYVVGNAILCHNEYAQNLAWIRRRLKPGGQLLFFEQNYWNPQVLLKSLLPAPRRWFGNAECQVGLRRFDLMKIASGQGFTHIEAIPYDIVHPRTPTALIPMIQNKAIPFEHTPLLKELCGTLYIWAKKPGGPEKRVYPNLADRPELFGKVSIVVPSHNEEMNVGPLADVLRQAYDPYIHEILFVNDNSSDDTAGAVRRLGEADPRIKLLDRKPPNGVGLALADGYRAATGDYILSMDCDFGPIVPEFRDVFDAVADGYDGAVGSRFTHDSVLINYPYFKILCNRAFHLLVKLTLLPKARDLSNNLKLYRSEILKELEIEEPHFAANAETGLKPMLAGYRIREAPISWINRTVDMGSSSFRIIKVAPNYAAALARVVWREWRHRLAAVGREGKARPRAADHA